MTQLGYSVIRLLCLIVLCLSFVVLIHYSLFKLCCIVFFFGHGC